MDNKDKIYFLIIYYICLPLSLFKTKLSWKKIKLTVSIDDVVIEEFEMEITHSHKSRLMFTEIIKTWLLKLYNPYDKGTYQEGRELGPIATRAQRVNPIKKKGEKLLK